MLFLQLQQLVGLLLVFHHGEGDFGVPEYEHHLGGHRILVHGDRNAAERLGRDHRGIEPGTVLADDGQMLTGRETQLGEARCNCFDLIGELAPGGGLPDAVDFFAQRRFVRARGRVFKE